MTLRHYTSAERKEMPVHTGVMLYFPDALCAIARVSKKGNDKHNPGAPLGWQRHKSTDQTDCLTRHMLTPTALDPDSGELELAHAAWRLLAELQLREEARLGAAGIKPLSGVVPEGPPQGGYIDPHKARLAELATAHLKPAWRP